MRFIGETEPPPQPAIDRRLFQYNLLSKAGLRSRIRERRREYGITTRTPGTLKLETLTRGELVTYLIGMEDNEALRRTQQATSGARSCQCDDDGCCGDCAGSYPICQHCRAPFDKCNQSGCGQRRQPGWRSVVDQIGRAITPGTQENRLAQELPALINKAANSGVEKSE